MLTLLALLPLLPLTHAHFSLNAPPALGANTNSQTTSPCGGFTISSTSTRADFFIGGDAVGVVTGHPQVNQLIRGSLDSSASGNWTNLYPTYTQYGLGALCQPKVPAPADWAGQTGVIQVVQSADDGILYACAAVTFRAGNPPSLVAGCTNASATASYTGPDPKLPSDGVGNSAFGSAAVASGGSTTVKPSSSATSAGTAAATSKAAGSRAVEVGGSLLWGGLAAVGAWVVL